VNKWIWTLIIISVLGISLIGIFNNLNYKPEEGVENYLISNEIVNVLIENDFILFNPVNKKIWLLYFILVVLSTLRLILLYATKFLKGGIEYF